MTPKGFKVPTGSGLFSLREKVNPNLKNSLIQISVFNQSINSTSQIFFFAGIGEPTCPQNGISKLDREHRLNFIQGESKHLFQATDPSASNLSVPSFRTNGKSKGFLLNLRQLAYLDSIEPFIRAWCRWIFGKMHQIQLSLKNFSCQRNQSAHTK